MLPTLDLQGRYDLGELRANLHRLDRELLDTSLERHRAGFFVIGQTETADSSRRLEEREVPGLLAFLRQHFRHVVIDGLRRLDGPELAVLEAAEAVVLLVTQEVVAVRDARRAREALERLGVGEPRLRLVVNRFQKGSRIDLGLLSDTVGLPVAATLANDWPSLGAAVQRGALLFETAPRSALAHDLSALAASLPGASAPAPSHPRPLWSRLLSRR
ncbi:MAG: hypothetical protein QM765_47040 [Myxococcales bacterium]